MDDHLFVDRDLAYDLLWSFVRTLSTRLRETNDKMPLMAVTSKFQVAVIQGDGRRCPRR